MTCSDAPDEITLAPETTVDCFVRHLGPSPELFCRATNVIMNIAFLQASVKVKQPGALRGFLRSESGCPADLFREDYFHYDVSDGARALVNGFEGKRPGTSSSGDSELTKKHQQSRYRVREAIFLLSPDDMIALKNPWYGLEVVLHVYESILFHGMQDREGVVLYFSHEEEDYMGVEETLYGGLLSRISSSTAPVTTLAKYLKQKQLRDPVDVLLSIEDIIFVPQNVEGVLKEHFTSKTCVGSPLIKSFVGFALAKMKEVDVQTWQKKLLLLGDSLAVDSHYVDEVYKVVVNSLKGSRIQVLVLDSAVNPLSTIISKVRESFVVTGFTGPQLTHTIWMRQGGAVIELSRSFYCHCYSALANWVGLNHERMIDLPRQPSDAALILLQRISTLFNIA